MPAAGPARMLKHAKFRAPQGARFFFGLATLGVGAHKSSRGKGMGPRGAAALPQSAVDVGAHDLPLRPAVHLVLEGQDLVAAQADAHVDR